MGVTRCLIFISLFSPIQGSELNSNILLIMELEELRDALKIASARSMLSLKSCWSVSIKKFD